MFRVPEGDCCLLCVSILAEDRVISSVLSNLSVLRETQSHSRLPGKRGDPSVRPRPPGAPCTPLCPRRAGGTGGWCGPATYLLLGPAELLLHLLGEQAGRASRLALRHPAGSGRLARRPVVFWRPPRRKCGSQHASHPAVAVAAPPHAARDPRGRAGSSGGPLRAQPPRPEASGATSAQPRPPRGTPGAQAGLPLFGGGGWTLGPALRGCSFKSSVEAAHPAGRGAPAPRNRVFESGPRPIRARRQFAITISTGKELERWGRKIAISA